MILDETTLKVLQDDEGMVDFLKVTLLNFIREITTDEDVSEQLTRAHNVLIDAIEDVIEAREEAIRDHEAFMEQMEIYLDMEANVIDFDPTKYRGH